MPLVLPVRFAYASRDLWFDPAGTGAEEGDHVICKTERGTEFGLAVADAFEVPASELSAPLKSVVRVASDEDIERAEELAAEGDEALPEFRRLVEKNKLDMKPVAVEYLFGGERAVFYFAAEDRVDFRQLVKDLSSRFRTRVDMRQIGVRDETRLIGGYAHCGQELCCKRFGGNFEPVSIRMAKEQDLPLNSAKISGMCGRLMCCLRYEFEAYKDFKGRAPKKKAVISTPLGKAKILEYDTPKERLKLRLENGKVFHVDLAAMTCSEEACERAKTQGCTCRPDTVTREALDAIESPDIALALLELDRENGVAPDERGLSSSDRIVSSPTPRSRRARGEGHDDRSQKQRTPRRRRSSEDAPETRPNEGSAGSGAQQPKRRRRHLSSADREQAFLDAASKQTAREKGEGEAVREEESASRTRRTRRSRSQRSGDRRSSQDAAEKPVEQREGHAERDAQREGATPRRRRHKSASQRGGKPQQQGSASAGSAGKPDVPSVAEQVASGEVHVRRRPGDKGGSRPASGAGGDAHASERSSRPEGEASGQGSEPQKRRRRRRRPRSGGNGEGGSFAPSAPSAPEGGER